MILVSNNPKILNLDTKYSCLKKIDYIDTLDILKVLEKVRDSIHLGHKLLSHPLSGSVKPGETPYKSILITYDESDLDMQSLLLIEDSIGMAKKFIGKHNDYKWNSQSILNDFSTIDYGLINSALQSSNQL